MRGKVCLLSAVTDGNGIWSGTTAKVNLKVVEVGMAVTGMAELETAIAVVNLDMSLESIHTVSIDIVNW